MLKRDILFDDDATAKLLTGAHTIAKAVGTTLGPRGRNVSFSRQYGVTTVVHDGVTVANQIELADPFEAQAAEIIRDAARDTNDAAGDGTTTAIVLSEAILKEGHKLIAAGHNVMVLRRGVQEAVKVLDEELKNLSIAVTTKKQRTDVAIISAQDKAIGKTIVTALDLVKDGVVTVDESGNDLSIDYKEGMQFDKGLMHPIWVTDPAHLECTLEDVSVLVTDHKISDVSQIEPLLEEAVKNKQINIVLIAADITGSAKQFLIENKRQNNFNLVPVRAPGIGDDKADYLGDIATLTGARFISEAGDFISETAFSDLGRAKRITIGKDSTIIVDGEGIKEDIDTRVAGISEQMARPDIDSFRRERLRERKSKLTSGVAIIHVGGRNEAETRERKERVIDAIGATKAAIEQGVVPGGETALLRVRDALLPLKATLTDEESYGVDIVYRACAAPFRLLVENGGEDAGALLGQVLAGTDGYDVMTRQLCDLVSVGVIDPVKVTRNALANAAVAATSIMTIGASIAPAEEVK